jgi:hypothetical protein
VLLEDGKCRSCDTVVTSTASQPAARTESPVPHWPLIISDALALLLRRQQQQRACSWITSCWTDGRCPSCTCIVSGAAAESVQLMDGFGMNILTASTTADMGFFAGQSAAGVKVLLFLACPQHIMMVGARVVFVSSPCVRSANCMCCSSLDCRWLQGWDRWCGLLVLRARVLVVWRRAWRPLP